MCGMMACDHTIYFRSWEDKKFGGQQGNMSRHNLVSVIAYSRPKVPVVYTLYTLATILLIYTFSFFGILPFGGVTTAHAAAIPGGNITNAQVRAVDLAKPAVVRIITTVGGNISVRFPTAANATVTFPQAGGNYDMKISGSGTFISSSGDIITADHVIKPPHDHSMDMELETMAAQDIADYVNQHYAASTTYTKNDVMGALESGYFLSDKHYTDSASEVYMSTDYTGQLAATDIIAVPDSIHAKVDQILQESAVDEKDMALIHVKMANTPSVQFGDSSSVAQQDTLTIIGFPGNGDISTRKDPTTFLTSSVNKIFVSAMKKTDSGADVIQVGGNVEHGDSGGPALDSNGNIVGIVSFGLEASAPYGSTFLQASNNAKAWLTALKLDTRPGSKQKAWKQAFTDYASTQPGHWHKAQSDFKKIMQAYPDFKAVTPILTYVNREAQTEPTPQQSTKPLAGDYIIPLAVSGILVILLLLFIGWVITKSRRLKKNATSATQATYSSEPTTPTVPAPPHHPYSTDNDFVIPDTSEGLPGQYNNPQQDMSQPDWQRQEPQSDIIPTQPLGQNTQER